MPMSASVRWKSLVCVLACACAPALAADGAGWSVRLALKQDVNYKGLPLGDNGGAAGAMMYPAPNLVGLMAGIVAHGLVAGAMRSGEKSDAEKAADKVVDPYRSGLAGFTEGELARAALARSELNGARLVSTGETSGGKVLDTAPVFYLAQERDALVLDNTVAVSGASGEPYRNLVRIVSRPQAAGSWDADGARALKTESAAMLALSLDIAAAQAAAAPASGAAPQQRTVRYTLGAKEVFERAEILQEHCGRALIRNLRGWLMSVPLRKQPEPADPACQDQPAL
jgi:hypothetical protein